MKQKLGLKGVLGTAVFLVLIGAQIGCSTSQPQEERTGKVALNTPPVIINPRVEPSQVRLDRDFSARKDVLMFADVKSLGADLNDVKVQIYFSPDVPEDMRFFNKPVVLGMRHLSGSTWEAKLTEREIAKLAINGERIQYEGRIIATNDKGQTSTSDQPIRFVIEAPANATRQHS